MRISDWSSDVCSSDLDAKAAMPIIVVTADTAHDLRARCLEAGADEVLFKPVAMDSLFDAIGRLMARGTPAGGVIGCRLRGRESARALAVGERAGARGHAGEQAAQPQEGCKRDG